MRGVLSVLILLAVVAGGEKGIGAQKRVYKTTMIIEDRLRENEVPKNNPVIGAGVRDTLLQVKEKNE